MGVEHIEHINGVGIFECKNCSTNVSNNIHIESRNFRASTGRAYLFNKVVNVMICPEKKETDFLTGTHIVRDVLCKKCSVKLGWYYEFAQDKTQVYKEGKIVLERSLLKRADYE